MTILITGGTGLIGRQLGLELVKRGHKIVGLTRNKKRALAEAPYPADWIECDLSKSVPDLSRFSIEGVFHLAGENVGEKSWSTAQKEKILSSRTAGTSNLVKALGSQSKVEFVVGASAVGFYGHTENDDQATETTPLGQGFLAEVTQAWEKASTAIPDKTRLVLFRIGVVLSTEGGALPKMLFPAQIFASSSLGSGKQWMSWVHIKDVVNAFLFAMTTPQMKGTYNLVAPKAVRQKEMAQEIATQISAPMGPPVPGFALNMMLGEQGSLALMSLRVSAEKLVTAGFRFAYPDLNSALSDILKGWEDGITIRTFQQYFDKPRSEVFKFFAEAKNLEVITPKFLNFHIVSMSTEKMEKNTQLVYRLKVHGVPVKWTTVIETWSPEDEFVDNQLKGPYTLWHHTHTFETLGSGTLMTDTVRYKVPLGKLGRLVAQAFVDRDVQSIFDHRRDVIEDYL